MPAVQRGDPASAEALRRRHNGCVDAPEREVTVSSHQGRNPHPIPGLDLLWDQLSGSEISKQADLGFYSDPCPEKVSDLGDHENRHQSEAWIAFEQSAAAGVLGIVRVVRRI